MAIIQEKGMVKSCGQHPLGGDVDHRAKEHRELPDAHFSISSSGYL